MKQAVRFLVFCLGVFVFSMCRKDDDPVCTLEVSQERINSVNQDRLALDQIAIANYLSENQIPADQVQQINGVSYVITQLGTGPKTTCLENIITVKYQGRLLSGTIFDPSVNGDNNPDNDIDWEENEVNFRLSTLILGWQIVLPSIPAGTKLTIYIPSVFGYGISGGANGVIPSHAPLIFDMELVRIQ